MFLAIFWVFAFEVKSLYNRILQYYDATNKMKYVISYYEGTNFNV